MNPPATATRPRAANVAAAIAGLGGCVGLALLALASPHAMPGVLAVTLTFGAFAYLAAAHTANVRSLRAQLERAALRTPHRESWPASVHVDRSRVGTINTGPITVIGADPAPAFSRVIPDPEVVEYPPLTIAPTAETA